MTAWNPQPADWVLTRAKVVEVHPNGVDLGLELFSKTDQYTAFVRRDLCQPTDKPIPDEPDDESVALVGRDAFQRVGNLWVGVASHSGLTWAELNRLDEVEVIHHA